MAWMGENLLRVPPCKFHIKKCFLIRCLLLLTTLYDRVVEMRQALQRLGPTLVELKMLNP